jgi:hypothetical protein
MTRAHFDHGASALQDVSNRAQGLQHAFSDAAKRAPASSLVITGTGEVLR